MAVHLAAKVPPNSTVSIYMDNQSTLAAITSPPDGPGSHIIEALNDEMKSIHVNPQSGEFHLNIVRNSRFSCFCGESGKSPDGENHVICL